jgi:hypothetical protein
MEPNQDSVAQPGGRLPRRSRRRLRGCLAALAAPNTIIGGWALVAPRAFYDRFFPGLGSDWVSALGPYDEHLVRDFGGALLAIGVLLWLAAGLLERRLVQAALMTAIVQSVPHLAFHLTTIGALGALADVLSLLGLFYLAAFPVALLFAADRMRPPPWRQPVGNEGAWVPPR